MDFCKFSFPTTTPTTNITITSTAPQLPIDAGYKPNHKATESRSGNRQTASLGQRRKVLQINLNNLNDTEYELLKAFIEDDIVDGLHPFTYTDLITNESWDMWLESVSTGNKKGTKHFAHFKMLEEV